MQAVGHAMTILGWLEHLTADDMPPPWMWNLSEELERHFEQVKAKRRSGSQEDDQEWAPGETIENEYAKGRRRAS